MATVKMHQIKSRIGTALAYIVNDAKTRDGVLVSHNLGGASTVAEFAARFETVWGQGTGQGSVLAQHVIQSFAPGEITAEQAHELGEVFAQQITGGKYQYVVATHVDKDHVHNHIIFNHTATATGRKFRCTKDTVQRFRQTSDRLCRRAGLSVLPDDRPRREVSCREYRPRADGRGWKDRMRWHVDRCIQLCKTPDELRAMLARAQIRVEPRGRDWVYTDERSGVRVRANRLGSQYGELAVHERLGRVQLAKFSVHKSLIYAREDNAVKIRIPGNGGRYYLHVPATFVTVDKSSTVRFFLAQDTPYTVCSRDGEVASTYTPEQLYEWFSRPDILREPVPRYEGQRVGRTEAQQRFFDAQQRRMEQLHEQVVQLNIAATIGNNAGKRADTIVELREQLGAVYRDRHEIIVALQEVDDGLARGQLTAAAHAQRHTALRAELGVLDQRQRSLTETLEALAPQKPHRRSFDDNRGR